MYNIFSTAIVEKVDYICWESDQLESYIFIQDCTRHIFKDILKYEYYFCGFYLYTVFGKLQVTLCEVLSRNVQSYLLNVVGERGLSNEIRNSSKSYVCLINCALTFSITSLISDEEFLGLYNSLLHMFFSLTSNLISLYKTAKILRKLI